MLRREEGDVRDERPRGPQRTRLIEAHQVAQAFYADALATPDAVAARQFLGERGFDQESAERFGVGFAPRDGDALLRHLRQKGFTDEETVAAGLVAIGRSAYDRFRGRLLWPIRDSSGDTIGFGARRIFDDDRIEAKYLNTPETPIYKKSQVLYGIDLARREIARSIAGGGRRGLHRRDGLPPGRRPTAVATCGTAFGDDHARVLRRFLNDHEEFRGEVIFTFDGDAAGQKAALRAFGGDQNFVAQTYVAVEPTGLDPCDLRIQQGDAAVRELIARRRPLYRFVLENVVSKYDLDRADGRVDAMREAARLVSSIRDRSKVEAFAREIAGHGRRRRRAGAHRGTPRRRPRPRGLAAGSHAHRPRPRRRAQRRQRRPLRRCPTSATRGSPSSARPSSSSSRSPTAVARTTKTSAPTTSPTRPTAPSGSWSSSCGGLGAADAGWAARLRDAASDQAVAARSRRSRSSRCPAARARTTRSSPTPSTASRS